MSCTQLTHGHVLTQKSLQQPDSAAAWGRVPWPHVTSVSVSGYLTVQSVSGLCEWGMMWRHGHLNTWHTAYIQLTGVHMLTQICRHQSDSGAAWGRVPGSHVASDSVSATWLPEECIWVVWMSNDVETWTSKYMRHSTHHPIHSNNTWACADAEVSVKIR